MTGRHMQITRLRTIPSHTGHGRFLAECSWDPIAEIERQSDIPSPYAYAPTHSVYDWHGRAVFIVETKHRHYVVFEVTA